MTSVGLVPDSMILRCLTDEERKQRRRESQTRYYQRNTTLINEQNRARIKMYYEDPVKREEMRRANIVNLLNRGVTKKPRESTVTKYAILYDTVNKKFI